jgi:Zn-finger nucleic acid-binding protein
MDSVSFFGVTVERCKTCREIWFDKHELQKAVKRMGFNPEKFNEELDVLPIEDGSTTRCPGCGTTALEYYYYHSVRFGVCMECSGMLLSHSKVNLINKTLKSREDAVVGPIGDNIINAAGESAFDALFELVFSGLWWTS